MGARHRKWLRIQFRSESSYESSTMFKYQVLLFDPLGVFFWWWWGGGAGHLQKSAITSDVRVQITQMLVRLITLISLNKLYTNSLTEVSEKIFTDGISMDYPQKMYNFCVLKDFISNFTYYKRY